MSVLELCTIKDAIDRATLQMEGGSLLNARTEAEMIVEDAVGLGRAELYLDSKRQLSVSEREFIEAAITRRLEGEPLQYILGHQQFRHLDLTCRQGVLIPRPETELLVEEALVELRSLGGPRIVLDIGCGTGAIALSIAHEYSEAQLLASDISQVAVELTEENSERYGLSARVKAVRANLFEGLNDIKGRFDMIVSNPPYIPQAELVSLQREVQFEPTLALDGGEDGLNFYRAIIEQSPTFLRPGGMLLLEVGFGQAEDVAALSVKSGYFTAIQLWKDYQGIDRIVTARRV